MPDIQAQTADGVIHSFPDGTAPEVMDKAIKQYISSTSVPTEKQAAANPPKAPVLNMETGPERNQRETKEMTDKYGPMLASPIAPAGAAASIPGAILGTAGTYLGAKLGDKYGPWARDLGGLALGLLGTGAGDVVGNFGNSLKFSPKTEVQTPLGTIRYTGDLPSEGTGAPLPASGDFYENRGEDLMKRPDEKLTPDEIAQNRLNQKVATISAEVRAGLRPSPEDQIQSTLSKEFTAGEKAGRVPQDIAPPRTPVPTYPPKGAPGSAPGSAPLGRVGQSVESSGPGMQRNVLLAPIKNGPRNTPEGNIQNVPRGILLGIIHRTGDPAAVDEFARTTNTPVLYVPESYEKPLGKIKAP